jgi:penicillin-binding protein 1B
LLTAALQGVVREGTAQSLTNWLPADLHVAGKTGTTDDLRDSWFAGYTGNLVAVVWIGRDDNKPSGLTGASGAMTVWGEMMKSLQLEPLQPTVPDEIEMVNVDPASGTRYDDECKTGVLLPFIKGSAPSERSACAFASAETPKTSDNPVAKEEAKPEKPEAKPVIKQEPEKKNWLQKLFK